MPRIGMLTPSSNTVLEPMTMVMASGVRELTVHFSRFRVVEIGLDAAALAQFDDAKILQAAELLADAKVDVIAWNGTSASWLGLDRDHRLVRRIEAATGIKACTCVLGLHDIFARMECRTIGLVTPYTSDVQERIVASLAEHGIACVEQQHVGLRDNHSFADVSEERIAGMLAKVAAAAPQAIVVLCTNMAGARIAAAAEEPSGPLILDSVAVTLWTCLVALDLPPKALGNWGRLFRDERFQRG